MAKMNWDKVRVQNRARRNGIQIDNILESRPRKKTKRAARKTKPTSTFVPKIIVRSRSEQVIYYGRRLCDLTTEILMAKTTNSRIFRQNAIRKFNDYMKKLPKDIDDPEALYVIREAKSAMCELNSRPGIRNGQSIKKGRNSKKKRTLTLHLI